MSGVKTVQEALRLPEIESEIFEFSMETLADGTTVRHRKRRPLSPRDISGDDIIIFSDGERAWKVVMTESGPAKVRFTL